MAENLTIMKTPPRRACSTESKKKLPNREKLVKPLPFNLDTTEESLGILSFDASSIHPDCEDAEIPTKETSTAHLEMLKYPAYVKMMEKMEQRTLSKKNPDKYLGVGYKTFSPETCSVKQSSAESTVCEMDLLRNKSLDSSDRPSKKFTEDLDFLQDKLKNTDLSIKEIFSTYGNNADISEIDSGMFVPGECALEKIKADEMSWRKEHDIPANKVEKDFSYNTQGSLSNFFAMRSDDCSSIFNKKSPVRGKPVGLISNNEMESSINSTINDSKDSTQCDSSVVSLTQINKLLASNDTTANKFVDLITNYKKSVKSYTKESLDKLNKTTLNASKYTLGNIQMLNSVSQFNKMSSITNAQSLNCLMDTDKENRNTMDKSLTSVRSASSMDCLPNGKPPIECTRTVLTWGCVKVGKVGTQEFYVRNRYRHRTRFQITSSNPNYKILNIETDPLPKAVVLLHPMESRKIVISFTPATIGSQIGKLVFIPIIKGELQQTQRQTLRMHGYGGHSNVEIQNISKDSTGKFWLSLGNISSQCLMQQNFVIRNTGSISGFAWLSIATKTICSFANIEVHPSHIVLKPNEVIDVSVLYKPSKLDFKHINANFSLGMDIFEIAQIKVVTGSEAIRVRLNRLTQRLKDEGMEIENMLKEVGRPFEGECVLPDLKSFNESFEAMKELKYHLTCRDISLTIEQDPDKSLVEGYEGMESSLFQTLSNSLGNFTMVNCMNKTVINCFTAEPSTIILTPPFKVSDSILFTSESKMTLTYDIKLEPEGVIDINRRDGMIKAGEMKVLNICCAKTQYKGKQTVRVLITIDNDILVVEVKVIFNLKQ